MATLTKDYGITLNVNTESTEYAGAESNQFFGGSSDRIAMLEIPAPAELGAIEYMGLAILRLTIKADTTADTDNITIGLIEGSWAGNNPGYATLIGYITAETGTYALTTSTTATEKTFDVTALLQAWAEDPTAYAGIYFRCSTLSLARISATGCDITTTVAERSAVGAPTSVSMSGTVAETDPTLTWSGAANGTNNDIDGYDIEYAESADGTTYGEWNTLKTVTSTAASGNTTVALAATRGYYRKYQIRTSGDQGIDSAWVESVAVRYNSAPTAPTAMTLSPGIYESGNIVLGWSGAADADGNIQYYQVQQATSADNITYGDWATLTSTETGLSYTFVLSLDRGYYARYQVQAIDVFGVASGYTAFVVTARRNSVPAAPTISAPNTAQTIYNSRPRILVTVGTDADSQNQIISASGFTASRSTALAAGSQITLRRTSAASEGTVSISAIATDTQGAVSAAGERDTTYAVPSFTDDPITTGTTKIKAAHMNELRTMIDTARAYYGIAGYAWTETITAGVTKARNWPEHVIELRAAITETAAAVNAWDAYSVTNRIILPDWIPLIDRKPRADVMEQIRAAIALL